jgi:hypothetical protein
MRIEGRSTKMASNTQPAFTAYAVSSRGEGKEDWWTPIGAAFPHGDGHGYNIVLQTIPLDGKIVLRPPKERDDRPSDDERTKQAVRDTNDRRRAR